jgi:hypothetical protein
VEYKAEPWPPFQLQNRYRQSCARWVPYTRLDSSTGSQAQSSKHTLPGQRHPAEAVTVRSRIGRHRAQSCLCGNTDVRHRSQKPRFLVTSKSAVSAPIDDCENSGVTRPISNNTKKIRKSGIKLVLPHDGQHNYPLRYRSVPAEKHEVIKTYTALANTENTYLGTTTNGGIKVWKAMHIEYIVGAMLAVTLKLSNTIRTLPNMPTGESIALRSPPTLPSA